MKKLFRVMPVACILAGLAVFAFAQTRGGAQRGGTSDREIQQAVAQLNELEGIGRKIAAAPWGSDIAKLPVDIVMLPPDWTWSIARGKAGKDGDKECTVKVTVCRWFMGWRFCVEVCKEKSAASAFSGFADAPKALRAVRAAYENGQRLHAESADRDPLGRMTDEDLIYVYRPSSSGPKLASVQTTSGNVTITYAPEMKDRAELAESGGPCCSR